MSETLVSIPVDGSLSDSDLSRAIVGFFLDWELPPERIVVEMIHEDHVTALIYGGER